jgi:hypothetical protein
MSKQNISINTNIKDQNIKDQNIKDPIKIEEKHIKSPEEKKEKNKEIKIPNSLIIYIKTRTPNYYKLNYEPSMTVPKSKSHTVFFDPLIKYYELPIKEIPSYSPKDTLYTQFFESNQFDTMINRTLSDFRYMQKPRTFDQAYNEGIINNNIKLTLQNLFNNDQLFYINNSPYTIVGSNWNENDWQIDKKPIEMLIAQNPHIQISKLIEEAKKEVEVIPETMRQGEHASSGIINKDLIDTVSAGLQNASLNTSKDKPNAFIAPDQLMNVDDDNHLKKLYTKYIQLNEPINYFNTTDKIRDPLTLSILIDPKALLKFINKNKNTDIVNSYAAFMKSKANLFNVENEYKTTTKTIMEYKDKLDDLKKAIASKLNTTNIDKQETIKELIELKLNYIKQINNLLETVNSIYDLQKVYFSAVVQLLTELKNDYVNIIKYYKKPELALKCIDYDITTINAFITKDNNNVYSESYFSNYTKFKTFYDKQTSTQEKENQDLTQVNYTDEIQKYSKSNDLLYIEEKEYESKIIHIFVFYSYNQFDIWVLLFKSLKTFTYSLIAQETSNILILTNNYINNYNTTYDTNAQTNFLTTLKVDGVKSTYNATNKTFDWFLVQKDGTRCLPEDKSNTLYGGQETLYISLLESKIHAFDAVMLYINLLEIICLRQYHVYISEQNQNQFTLELAYNSYGLNKRIKTVVNSNNELSKLDTFTKKYISNNINLDDKIKKQSNKIIIFRARISSIIKAKTLLLTECQKLQALSVPYISSNGFIDKCNLLLQKHFTDIPQHSFRSSYWLEKEITNYDVKKSSDLMYYISEVIKDSYYDHILDNKKTTEYLNWMVYNNTEEDGLLISVCDALNGQLDLDGNDTNNKYTDIVDGKKRFTIDSLKRLISENQQQQQQVTPEIILQQVLKIKFITFEMFSRSNKKIQLGDIVNYTYGANKQKKTGRVFKINTTRGGINYDIYDGEFLDNVTAFIRLSEDNVTTKFRINCTPVGTDYQFNNYIFLLMTKTRKKTPYYRLIRNSEYNKYIYNFGDIPNYILYFIFINCYWNSSDPNNSVFNNINDFSNVFREFQNKKDNIKIDVSNRHDYLNDELEVIKKSLVDKRNELKILKQTNENIEKINSVKSEIFDLKQRQESLEGKIAKEGDISNNRPNYIPSTIQNNVIEDEPVTQEPITQEPDLQQQTITQEPITQEPITQQPITQQPIRRPNKRFDLQQPIIQQPIIQQPIIQQPIIQQPIIQQPELQNDAISGGAVPNVNPSNMYSEYTNQPYQNTSSNQNLSQQQNIYPLLMQNQMLLNKLYNETGNNATGTENQKSKLAFYISIDLELFPGKTVNALQKSMVKCNSTFDKIREAYAEIFGYQYRPKPHAYKANKVEPEPNKVEPEPNKVEPNKVGGFNKTVKIKRR